MILDHSEYSLYEINEKLRFTLKQYKNHNSYIVPFLCSINNHKRIREILGIYNVDIIYHAAAYKHVPLSEMNVSEVIQNNVFGSLNLIQSAIEKRVKKFVLISTDKAVRPTNIMGATKRITELIVQAMVNEKEITFKKPLSSHSTHAIKTKFSMVRFGNVLGSSGSVVPKFKEQIKLKEDITITHTDITRFFMTISEAAQLVIQSAAMARSNNPAEVFILKMGNRVRIYDLALRMIELSGYSLRSSSNPNGDIAIKEIGLRPGEKLHEELLIGNNAESTNHNMILKAKEDYIIWEKLLPELELLATLSEENKVLEIHKLFEKIVEGFKPDKRISDNLYKEKK